MTHQIALPPDQERRLVQQASLRGLDAEDYLRQIVVSWLDGGAVSAPGATPEMVSVDEWLDALAVADDALPILDSKALTRERLYADHD